MVLFCGDNYHFVFIKKLNYLIYIIGPKFINLNFWTKNLIIYRFLGYLTFLLGMT
jgi:hypothetical protein